MGLDDFIRIHNIIFSTKVLGPETRAAIWFQGCNRDCYRCMSPETRPLDAGRTISIKRIVDVLAELDSIEGITISGGEPFLQRHALFLLLKEIREKTNLGIIIYTGYTVDELGKIDDEEVNEILTNLCDLIIDGEYIDDLNDGMRLKGSSNQKLVFVTDRYKKYLPLYEEKCRSVEIVVKSNDAFMYGIPDKDTLDKWYKLYKKQEGIE